MKYVFGVDPGKVTGFAAYDLEAHTLLESWEASTEEAYTTLEGWVQPFVHLAVERFVISQGTVRKGRGDQSWSIELIGLIRYLAFRARTTMQLQSASDAKGFSTDEKLKAICWWNAGHGHANDAARHVMLWLANHDPDELARFELFAE